MPPHTGRYSYRLCPRPEEGRAGLSEACFQAGALDFVGETQWVQYGEDESTRIAFKANRTRQGTWPAGSHWTKNPVPVCKDPTGGDIALGCPDCSHAGGYQFPPPAPGVFGYGQCLLNGTYTMPFSIVDQLQVPLNITEGRYVLSFRYDAEQVSGFPVKTVFVISVPFLTSRDSVCPVFESSDPTSVEHVR